MVRSGSCGCRATTTATRSNSSDAQNKVRQHVQHAAQFGLNWLAITNHGRVAHEKVSIDKIHPDILAARRAVPHVLTFQGLEWDIPAAEHGTVTFAPTRQETALLHEFERQFDGVVNATTASSAANEARSVVAIRWLGRQVAAGRTPIALFLANHPARRGFDSPTRSALGATPTRPARSSAATATRSTPAPLRRPVTSGRVLQPHGRGGAPVLVRVGAGRPASRPRVRGPRRPHPLLGRVVAGFRAGRGRHARPDDPGRKGDKAELTVRIGLTSKPNFHGDIPRLARVDVIAGLVTGPDGDPDTLAAPPPKWSSRSRSTASAAPSSCDTSSATSAARSTCACAAPTGTSTRPARSSRAWIRSGTATPGPTCGSTPTRSSSASGEPAQTLVGGAGPRPDQPLLPDTTVVCTHIVRAGRPQHAASLPQHAASLR